MFRRVILLGLALSVLASADEVDKMINKLAKEVVKPVGRDEKVVCWEIFPFETSVPSMLGRYLRKRITTSLPSRIKLIKPLEGEESIANELVYLIKYPTPAEILSQFQGDYSLSGYYILHEETKKIEVVLDLFNALSPICCASARDIASLPTERFKEFKQWDKERPPDSLAPEFILFLEESGTTTTLLDTARLVDVKTGTTIGKRLGFNEYFKIEVEAKKKAYIHILGFDWPTQRFYLLFPGPGELTESDLLPSAGVFALPRTLAFKTVPPAGYNWFKVIATNKHIARATLMPMGEVILKDEPLWIDQKKLKEFINILNTQSGGWQAVLTEVWIVE